MTVLNFNLALLYIARSVKAHDLHSVNLLTQVLKYCSPLRQLESGEAKVLLEAVIEVLKVDSNHALITLVQQFVKKHMDYVVEQDAKIRREDESTEFTVRRCNPSLAECKPLLTQLENLRRAQSTSIPAAIEPPPQPETYAQRQARDYLDQLWEELHRTPRKP
jgi:hypothetical protein